MTTTTTTTAANTGTNDWFMPEEGDPHARTWMAFGASAAIWGRDLVPGVRRDLAAIANAIARYEPVTMLVRDREYDVARGLLDDGVELMVAALDDLWMRDTAPVFAIDERGNKAAIDFNFNGWGEKQDYDRDARLAKFIARQAGAVRLTTDLVLEGGCIEVDGDGTAIITESCTLNDNRNPGVSKAEFEDLLMPLLGLDKIVWLPGIAGRDITDGHTDFYARFVRPGLVVAGYEPDPDSFDREVTLEHLEILEAATDARDCRLDVTVLEAPSEIREEFASEEFASEEFAAGYVGFYVCNGAVLVQEFGDARTDAEAAEKLQRLFPDRAIEPLAVDAIAAGGGSIHCATQQEPLA